MEINPNSGTFISLDEAVRYITAFAQEYPKENKGFFAGCDNLTRLLNQDKCIGLRMYNGYNETDGATNLVVVGVDDEGKDITSLILERLDPCPPKCDPNSPLNP